MKMKKNFIIVPAIVLLIGIVLFSCENLQLDDDTSFAVDNALVEAIFADEQNIADQSIDGKLSTYIPEIGESVLSNCASITLNLNTTPKTIVIDFGSTNCLCADNRYRKGKINLSFTGGYRDSGSVITHSFDDYHVNDYHVTGIKTVSNNGLNADGFLKYSIHVDAKIFKPGGDSIVWKSNRTNTWIEGDTTLVWWDDVYLIEGDGEGITSTGLEYTLDITNALRKEIGYKHLVSGTLELTPENKATRVIDYGDGTRDDQATISINGVTFNITLQ
jgi:hypothetical protein